MIPLQNEQWQILLAPGALTSGGTNVSSAIDMQGYTQAEIALHACSNTTTAAPVSLLIEHSDDLTTYTTIQSAGTATSGWPTQVSNATAVTAQISPLLRASVPWIGKKRYLRISVTGPTANTSTACAFVVKSRARVSPTGTSVSNVATNTGQTYVFPVI